MPEAISEHERVGCMWATIYGALRDTCLSFVLAQEPAKGEKGNAWKSMDMCRDRWKNRESNLLCLYALMSLPLAASEGEQVNLRKLPHSKLFAGDQSRLCCFNSWRFVLVIALAILLVLLNKNK